MRTTTAAPSSSPSLTKAALQGSPRQVAYASVLRARWVASQLELVNLEQLVAAGTPAPGHLEPGTEVTDSLRASFRDMAQHRLDMLCKLLVQRSSAKDWIESAEGRWARDFGDRRITAAT